MIDLVSQKSIHTWLHLRKISNDYGKKFFYRHEIFLPAIITVGIVSFVVVLEVSVLHFVTPEVTDSLNRLVYMCFISACGLFFLTLFLLAGAGKINSEYSYHKHIIKTNITFYKDIGKYPRFYFQELKDDQNCSNKNTAEKDLFDGSTMTYMHEKFSFEIKNRIGQVEDFYGKVKSSLKDLTDVSLKIVDALLDDEEYNCFKILGFKIESGTVVQFLIAFGSVAITLYEILGSQ